MKATDDVTQFLEPWMCPNKFGIPEVDFSEIKVGRGLGCGKKASTSEAVWNGKTVALKSWTFGGRYEHARAYSHWELSRYCDLKEAQGNLVPRLHFVCRRHGTLMLGLEMGQPVHDYCNELEDAKSKLWKALTEQGWKQRSGSWRNDNLVWMQNDDGSRRLVAIDLESFIPHFGKSIPRAPSKTAKMSYFGVPEVSPSEVRIHGCDETWEWTTEGEVMKGYWGKRPVTLLPKNWTRASLKIEMSRYSILEKVQGVLIPRPLFVARQRDGTLLLGCEEMSHSHLSWDTSRKKATEEMQKKFLSLGWTLHGMPDMLQSLSTSNKIKGKTSPTMILIDLMELETVIEKVTDESSSATKDAPISSRTRAATKHTATKEAPISARTRAATMHSQIKESHKVLPPDKKAKTGDAI